MEQNVTMQKAMRFPRIFEFNKGKMPIFDDTKILGILHGQGISTLQILSRFPTRAGHNQEKKTE